MAGLNQAANLPPQIQGYYDKRALITAENVLVHAELATQKTLPEGEGSTVTFWRYAPFTTQTSDLTETTDLGIPVSSRQQLVEQEVACTPTLKGDFISIGRLASLRSIDQGVAEKLDRVVQQGMESIDQILSTYFGTNLMRRRADGDTNFQADGTTTSAGSTTSIVDSGRNAADAAKPGIADGYYIGGYITFTSGPAYGMTSQITAYTNASGTFTVNAFPVAPGSGATYRVVVGTGIGNTSVINSRALRGVNLDLFNQKAMRFDKGFFKCALNPNMHFDFFDDPVFVKASEHKESMDGLETNEVGVFAGVQFLKSTLLYRETVAGAASTSGAVHAVPIVGKDALGVVSLGATPKGKKNINTYIRTWDQLGQPIPIYDTIGWQAAIGEVALNGCFGVTLLCGSSDQI